MRRSPIFTLFPYTTLFRSAEAARSSSTEHRRWSRPARPTSGLCRSAFAATSQRDLQKPLVGRAGRDQDRKSTRLNSSHANISYAVFCLKKKKQKLHLLSHS